MREGHNHPTPVWIVGCGSYLPAVQIDDPASDGQAQAAAPVAARARRVGPIEAFEDAPPLCLGDPLPPGDDLTHAPEGECLTAFATRLPTT